MKNDSEITVHEKSSKENQFESLTNQETHKKKSKSANKSFKPKQTTKPKEKSKKLNIKLLKSTERLKKSTERLEKPIQKTIKLTNKKSPLIKPNEKSSVSNEKPLQISYASQKMKNSSISQEKKVKNYQQTLARFEVYNQMKNKNLVELRLKYEKDKISNTSSTSFLSKNSSKYLKNKDYKPPYKKTQDEINHKRQSICNIKEKILKEKAIKEGPEPSFHPNISKTHENIRTKDQFYRDMMDWIRKKKGNNILRELKIRKNENNETTFHPEINYNSNNIANEKPREKKIENRLNNWKKEIDEKKQNLIKTNIPEFKPKISKNSQLLTRGYRGKIKTNQEDKTQTNENFNEIDNFSEDNFDNLELNSAEKKKLVSVSFNLDNNTVEEFQKIENEMKTSMGDDRKKEVQTEHDLVSKKKIFNASCEEVEII